MSNRKIFSDCSFTELICSDFYNQFLKNDNKGCYTFEGDGTKLVEIHSGYEDSPYCYGCFDVLYVLYKKAAHRWVKKFELSNDEARYDTEIHLEGDEYPEVLVFDLSYDSFEFKLTDDMIKELKFVYEENIDDYFPNYSKKSFL